ncbi:MAG: hypothetical protein PF484_10600 [Bacteroidales bacterium]|jgi:hypothetical protein|nr:hypothetical protein [Bacteroidales bacterium]
MKKITIGNIGRYIPTNWNQLKKHELLELSRLGLESPGEMEIKSQFFLYLTKLRILISDKFDIIILADKEHKTYPVSSDQFIDMVNTLDFLFLSTDDVFTFKSSLTKNLVPFFNIIKLKYLGPKDALTNISFGEFIESEKHYINYLKKYKEADLNQLVATLYRPENKKIKDLGDHRIAFHSESNESRSMIIQLLEPEIKFAILLFYEGCRLHLEKLFPGVFSGSPKTTSKKSKYGMADVVEGLCNDDPTKFVQIEASRLYIILHHLEKRIERADELKSKLKK